MRGYAGCGGFGKGDGLGDGRIQGGQEYGGGKAVKFSGKMTVKRGDVCVCCAKTLTDEFSMLTNMGKICANRMKVEYITDSSQVEAFRERYLKRIDEIGAMEIWAPKASIKEWQGGKSHIHKQAVESLS